MKNKSNYTSIGGSALIEGVMMRNGQTMAIAVRRADGQIVLKLEKAPGINKVISKIPLIRGIFSFVLSLITSYKALMYSADVSMEDIIEEPESKLDKWLTDAPRKGIMNVITVIATVIGVLFGIAAFIYLPTLMTQLFSDHVYALDSVAKRIVVGVFKMLIFILYMVLISRMKDMRRVFMYHGAEHKTIFCYESKKELTPENAKAFTRFHPRCGTSFIVITLIVSFAVSLIIPWQTALFHSVLKLLFLPFVMGLAYEFIRLAGKVDNTFTRIISAPGLWVQRITTKEPDDAQLEVAIAALRGVVEPLPFDTTLVMTKDGSFVPDSTNE